MSDSGELSPYMCEVQRLIVAMDLAMGEYVMDRRARQDALNRIRSQALRVAIQCEAEINHSDVPRMYA